MQHTYVSPVHPPGAHSLGSQLPTGLLHASLFTALMLHADVGAPLLPGLYLSGQVAMQLFPMGVLGQASSQAPSSSGGGRPIPEQLAAVR